MILLVTRKMTMMRKAYICHVKLGREFTKWAKNIHIHKLLYSLLLPLKIGSKGRVM